MTRRAAALAGAVQHGGAHRLHPAALLLHSCGAVGPDGYKGECGLRDALVRYSVPEWQSDPVRCGCWLGPVFTCHFPSLLVATGRQLLSKRGSGDAAADAASLVRQLPGWGATLLFALSPLPQLVSSASARTWLLKNRDWQQ